MIHFFPTFSRSAAETAFGETLRRLGVEHRIFAGHVNTRYRSRLGLILYCLPQFAWFGIRSAFASLLRSHPTPDAVVLGTDIEVAIFGAAKNLFGRRRVRIVLGSFIFTSRGSPGIDALRRRYYGFILSLAEIAVVHSRLEVERYRAIWPHLRTRFVFVPYGANIDLRPTLFREAERAGASTAPPHVVSAGKSARDYRTLFEAVRGLDTQVRVICDYAGAVPPVPPDSRVTVLADCHGEGYFREVFGAAVVAIPLAADDISAGQMVLIQAMGLGRAVVVTDTPTVRDYATDGHDALLVPRGDPLAMREAIAALLGDPELRARLGRNAIETFDRNNGIHGHMQRILAAIATPQG
ncbi:MAG TPA: glycosyltransferase family 4 protein [Acetobacteraceae bacterium]